MGMGLPLQHTNANMGINESFGNFCCKEPVRSGPSTTTFNSKGKCSRHGPEFAHEPSESSLQHVTLHSLESGV
eukprot:698684-Amphidinium_carterae.1